MWERCDEARPPAGQDPDVIGLGVCLVHATRAGEDERQSPANPIDVLLVNWLRKPFRCLGFRFGSSAISRNEERRWPAAFNRYVLALGDVQLAMGFAVLAYGYASLAEKGLSMYHWWLIVGLVWFSVVTNLATTSYLRSYFAGRDPGERWWRIILLVFLVAILSFSMVPIYQIKERLANEHDKDEQRRILLTTNVLCYVPGHGAMIELSFLQSAIPLIGITIGIGLAVLSLLRLYERPGSAIFKWRDHYRGEMQQSFLGDGDNIITCIRCEQRHLLLIIRPLLAFWLVLRVYADFLNSVLTEISCTAATFTWVIVRFVDVLRLGGSLDEVIHRWNFGQILAVAFFVMPSGSLASCLCGTIGTLHLGNGLFRRPDLRKFKWPTSFARRTQSEHPQKEDTDQLGDHSRSMDVEGTSVLDSKNGSSVMQVSQEGRAERDGMANNCEDTTRMMGDANVYKVFPSPRFVIALPLAGFSNLLYLVLLFVLPRIPGYPSTPDVLWRTIFWYVVYQPLLLFAFFLAGMIVEERCTREGRMQAAYRIIAAVTAVLSTAAILDTLYGLGGIPMSYIGMGTLGLVLLVYLLYGCVARPGPLAKGKGRSRYPSSGHVEEGRPLLAETRRKILPEVRLFPVRKQKRWHGPSRRPQITRGRTSYGTID
ncbi:hypothetical protein F5Y05DRAFT_405590 [Hypoxylon sp. FL0543]|nr:hypothetical protein F5Y05DRAFT_405590 [Hypoxylon sp. FL0543]